MKHKLYTFILLILSVAYSVSVTFPLQVDNGDEMALLESESTDEESVKPYYEQFDYHIDCHSLTILGSSDLDYIKAENDAKVRTCCEQPETPPPNHCFDKNPDLISCRLNLVNTIRNNANIRINRNDKQYPIHSHGRQT